MQKFNTPCLFAASILVTFLSLFFVSFAHAGDIQFSGVTAFAGLYSKKVVSFHEAKYQNLVRQNTDYSCGAAALATILKFAYGVNADEKKVMDGMLKVSDPAVVRSKGFSMLDMKQYVEVLGMRGRGYRLSEARLKKLRIPVVVLLDINGYKHFSVLKRITDGEAYLADPVLGNRSMSFEKFKSVWANRVAFAVIGKGFDRKNPLLDMPFKLTSHQWRHNSVPVMDAELMDFGFTHADLF